MKKTINYLLLAVIASFVSCTNSSNTKTNEVNAIKYTKIEQAAWLIGKWQNKSAEGESQEIWEKKNDSTLIGASYFVVGNDTVSSESISLEERGSELLYIPTVKNQNDGKPIVFTLTSSTTNQLVFENPNHDFPQKITYTQIANDSLIAVISGVVNGKENSQNFPMTRAK
ncbi:MAG TPA: hypothetical protein DIW31_01350 [Bacteroidales bacterium]|nr:hypothetical protein [Bacteroidales bacterium]